MPTCKLTCLSVNVQIQSSNQEYTRLIRASCRFLLERMSNFFIHKIYDFSIIYFSIGAMLIWQGYPFMIVLFEISPNIMYDKHVVLGGAIPTRIPTGQILVMQTL